MLWPLMNFLRHLIKALKGYREAPKGLAKALDSFHKVPKGILEALISYKALKGPSKALQGHVKAVTSLIRPFRPFYRP